MRWNPTIIALSTPIERIGPPPPVRPFGELQLNPTTRAESGPFERIRTHPPTRPPTASPRDFNWTPTLAPRIPLCAHRGPHPSLRQIAPRAPNRPPRLFGGLQLNPPRAPQRLPPWTRRARRLYGVLKQNPPLSPHRPPLNAAAPTPLW